MFRIPNWLRWHAAALGLLAAGPGCGGGAPTVPIPGLQALPPVDSATAGSLSVHLVKDGLGTGLDQLNLAFAGLEVRAAGVWRPVPLDPQPGPVDLLAFATGSPLALATGVPWPQGTSDAVRFTLGPGATVLFSGEGEPVELAVPAQFASGLGPPGSFTLAPGGAVDLWLAFGVDGVVQVRQADPEDPATRTCTFVPGPVRGYDRAATGFISGRVAATAPDGTVTGLAGAVVTAQLQVPGGPQAGAGTFRTTQADADGRFTLDLLPEGAAYTWTAVSQASPAYRGAVGSPARALGDAPPYYNTFSCLVSPGPALATGTLGGTVAAPPGPGQSARVDLVAQVQADPAQPAFCPFVAASAPVGSDGTFTFAPGGPGLPAGIYGAVLHRLSLGPDLFQVDATQTAPPFLLTAGADLRLAF
jgi:hypothetical protein